MFHFNALVTAVVGTLIFGGRGAIFRRFSVSNFWPEMNRTGATMISTLGTMAYLLAHDVDRPEMPKSGSAGGQHEPSTDGRGSAAARGGRRHPGPLRHRHLQRCVRRDRGEHRLLAAAGSAQPAPRRRRRQLRILRRPDLRRRRQRAAPRHPGRDRRPAQAPAHDVRGLLGPSRGHGRDQPQLVVPHRRHRHDRRRRLPLLRRPQGRLPAPPRRKHRQLRGRTHPDGPRSASPMSRSTRCRAS